MLMDTRQLAAFVRRRREEELLAGGRAARRHAAGGEPADPGAREAARRRSSLDRSGRRVEPTEAGQRLYRNAQRVLAAEEQLLDELAEGERSRARFELGASTGPGGSVVPILLGELAAHQPRR